MTNTTTEAPTAVEVPPLPDITDPGLADADRADIELVWNALFADCDTSPELAEMRVDELAEMGGYGCGDTPHELVRVAGLMGLTDDLVAGSPKGSSIACEMEWCDGYLDGFLAGLYVPDGGCNVLRYEDMKRACWSRTATGAQAAIGYGLTLLFMARQAADSIKQMAAAAAN